MLPRLAALLAALAVVLAAAPATARAADERAAARAFGAATERLHRAGARERASVERRTTTLLTCFTAEGAEVPPRARRNVQLFAAAAFFDAVLAPLRPALGRFVAELDGVATDDRALRGGRAAWRSAVRVLTAFPSVPRDPCTHLRRWREAGFAPDAAPPLDFPAVARLTAQLDATEGRLERKIDRAAARLRQLGVSARTAERFGGELFD